MGKNVVIKVPTAHMEIKANKPEDELEWSTMHFIPVPAEALAEVQEVLKKYQPQMDRFNELLKKAIKENG